MLIRATPSPWSGWREYKRGLKARGPSLGTAYDRESVSEPLEVAAASRIHATRRMDEVRGRREEDSIRAQEKPRRHHRTRDDAALRRFETVRPLLKVASRARVLLLAASFQRRRRARLGQLEARPIRPNRKRTTPEVAGMPSVRPSHPLAGVEARASPWRQAPESLVEADCAMRGSTSNMLVRTGSRVAPDSDRAPTTLRVVRPAFPERSDATRASSRRITLDSFFVRVLAALC